MSTQGTAHQPKVHVQETPTTLKVDVEVDKTGNNVRNTVDSALASNRSQPGVVQKGLELTDAVRAAAGSTASSVAVGAKETLIDAPKIAALQAKDAAVAVRHRAEDTLQATKETLSSSITTAQDTAKSATNRATHAAQSVATGATDVLHTVTGATPYTTRSSTSPMTTSPGVWGTTTTSTTSPRVFGTTSTPTRGLIPTLYHNTLNTTASVFTGAREVAEVFASTLGGLTLAAITLTKRLAWLPVEIGSGAATTALGGAVAANQRLMEYARELQYDVGRAYRHGADRTYATVTGAERKVLDIGAQTTNKIQNVATTSAERLHTYQQIGATKVNQLVDTAKDTSSSVLHGGQQVASVATSAAYKTAGTVEGYTEGALHAAKQALGTAGDAVVSTVGPPAKGVVNSIAQGYEQGRGVAASVAQGGAETVQAVVPDHVPSVGEVGCATKQGAKGAIDAAAGVVKKGVDVALAPVSNC